MVSAGLADRDVEGVALDDRIAIAELRRRLRRRRNAREGFNEVGAGDSRVVRGAAAEELDPLDVEQFPGVEVESAEVRGVELVIEPSDECAHHGFALIQDFLVHEVRVPVAFVGVVLPLDRGGGFRDRAGVHGHGLEALRVDHRNLAVFEMHDLPGVAHERPHIGGNEHLAIADPDDDGRALARDHDAVRPRGIDDRDAVGAAYERECIAHPLLDGLLVGAGDEMRDDLGVGLGGELDPFGLQACAERRGVLDDAVVHHRDRVVRAHVRMGVGVARYPMGRPSRMPDSELSAKPLRQHRLELGELAGRLVHAQRVAGHQRDARGIVAAVLEPLQARHQDRSRSPIAYVADDSAHDITLLFVPVSASRGGCVSAVRFGHP